MPSDEAFELALGSDRLHGVITYPDHPGARPAVVICHGFKGFMEWGFFPYVASLLAERGVVAIRFNFRGSGMAPGDELVTDLDAFAGATIGREIEDVLRVVDAAGDELGGARVDRRRLGLFGHSRGGGAALLAAGQKTIGDRLAALVTWAAVSTFDRFGEEATEAWRRDGSLPIVNARTGQELAIRVEVLEDLERERERYDLVAAAGRRNCPWLIVHGGRDETVPPLEAEILAAAARPERQLLLLPDGDHTLGARHPYAGPTPELIQAMNATQSWFRSFLKE